jgi:uncharacterized protein YgiM (DUF1202 family)
MPQGIVRGSRVNLRRSPKDGEVIKQMRKGSRVEVLGEETWALVRTGTGEVGWMLSDFVDKDVQVDLPTVTADEPTEAPTALSPTCTLEVYHNDRFQGGKEISADRDFFPHLDRLNGFARETDVFIHVTSSAREPDREVNGAIVTPASRSNHMVGHAIDMNIKTATGFFNSKALAKAQFNALPANVKRFINLIREDEVLRWGGDFSKEDPVHIDDELNRRHSDIWDSKLASRGHA